MRRRYIMHTHLYEMYKHAFYVCAIWYTLAFSFKNYCSFITKSYCSDVCGYHQCPQTLVEIYRNMGICFSFRAVAARQKYPGFMLSGNPLVSLTWAMPMSKILMGCQSASLDWHYPGLGVTKPICSIPLFSFFQNHQNTDYLLSSTFIFDLRCHSSASVTPVKVIEILYFIQL